MTARRRGFTLIEILVVVGIIMFLAAFVIVAAVRFGNNSREQATKALIQRLGMGINKYYGTYRIYPAESTALISAKKTSIYFFLTPHDDKTKIPVEKTPAFMEFNAGEVRKLGGKDWVVDAWGREILYFAVSKEQAQVGQFTLISNGADGKYGTADDISLSKVTY